MKIKPASCWAGIAGVLLLAAWCPSVAFSAAASAASRVPSPYLVGVSEPVTGAEAQAGTEIYDGELLAADNINAAGGVLGHKLALREEDDACDPQTSVNAANKLVSLGVQAMVGRLLLERRPACRVRLCPRRHP